MVYLQLRKIGILTIDKKMIIKLFRYKRIIKILKSYHPKLIILHGSRVKTSRISRHSDIDLIIVGTIFKCVNFLDRIIYSRNLLQFYNIKKVDLFCLTESEFEKSLIFKKPVYQSLKKGYKILYQENIRTGEILNEIFS